MTWSQGKLQKEIFEYVKFLVKLRKKHPILSGKARLRVLDYLACGYPDVSYHSERAWTPYFDAESRYFDKRIEIIEYDLENVPDDWDKDWDNLSFDERIALCEKCDVIYMATRVITASDE